METTVTKKRTMGQAKKLKDLRLLLNCITAYRVFYDLRIRKRRFVLFGVSTRR